MSLTAKQKKRIDESLPADKARLRAGYQAQNARNPPKPKQPAPFIGPLLPPGHPAAIRTGNASRRSAPPQPKRQPARPAPRIPYYLNPLCPHPVPSVLSDGMALPHTSLVSHDFNVGSTNTKVLVVTNVGNAGTVGCIYEIDPAGLLVGAASAQTVLTIPTLGLSDAQGGPSSGRAMKFSCSVVNCTNNLKRGGRVTYLNSSQRLPAPGGTVAQWNMSNLISGIKNSAYRRRIMGENLVHPKQLIGFPVDTSAYARFGLWHGTLSLLEFNEHTLGSSDVNPISDYSNYNQRPMSVVAFVFDPVQDPQDYSVTIRGSYYTRWPLESVPGQSMKTIPTAPPGIINAVNNAAEASANDLVHIGEGAVAATIGPRAASAVGGAIRSGFNALRAGAVGAVEAGEVELAAAAANPELLLPLLA